MKHTILQAIALVIAINSIMAQKQIEKSAGNDILINQQYQKAGLLTSIMKHYTGDGLPGVAMAVYTEKDGWWAGTAGYSRLEDKTPLHNDNIQYLQSVSKTYMAVAILKLYEQGKIRLDSPITRYLPVKYSRYIKQAASITVRMLLNHTSGIPEYSDEPAFITTVIEHPLTPFSIEQVLKPIANKDLMFAPGSRHYYVNTNYELLALIADAVTGDHVAFIAKNILEPLGLTNTWYRNNRYYLKNERLVNSYWDVLNTGRPANITSLQKVNVSSFIGDDGVVCTTTDAVKFLKGLMEGKLISKKTLSAMETWVNDDAGNPIYGLGLVHYEAGGIEGYGHSGGGIGGGCILMYIPSKKTYFFIATNVGTLMGGKLSGKANQLKDEIIETLLQ